MNRIQGTSSNLAFLNHFLPSYDSPVAQAIESSMNFLSKPIKRLSKGLCDRQLIAFEFSDENIPTVSLQIIYCVYLIATMATTCPQLYTIQVFSSFFFNLSILQIFSSSLASTLVWSSSSASFLLWSSSSMFPHILCLFHLVLLLHLLVLNILLIEHLSDLCKIKNIFIFFHLLFHGHNNFNKSYGFL
jgi:hypothetical protein